MLGGTDDDVVVDVTLVVVDEVGGRETCGVGSGAATSMAADQDGTARARVVPTAMMVNTQQVARNVVRLAMATLRSPSSVADHGRAPDDGDACLVAGAGGGRECRSARFDLPS